MNLLFSALIEFFYKGFSHVFLRGVFRVAAFASFMLLFSAAIAAYFSAAQELINALSQTVPEVVVGVWGWVMPSNAKYCFVAMISATLMRFASHWYFKLLYSKLNIVTK